MGNVVLIDSSKDPSWDAFVEKHPLGWVSHLDGWKRVIELSFPRAKASYLALREEGQIVAGLPIYVVKKMFNGRRLVSIPMATICDILAVSPDQALMLIGAAERLQVETGAHLMELRTLGSSRFFEDGQFADNRDYKHHFIRLEKDPDRLLKRFDRTCVRQRITRATSRGVEIERVENEAGLEAFFRVHLITRKRLGLPPHPYLFIRSIWDVFSSSGQVVVNLAKFQGHCIGGILYFQFNGRVSAEYLVSDENFRDLSPNHILLWDAIQKGCREGCEVFDFGRTHITNATLMDFKKRWSTEVVDLPVFYYPKNNHVSHLKQRNSSSHEIAVKILKRMPLPLLKAVGSGYYRFFS